MQMNFFRICTLFALFSLMVFSANVQGADNEKTAPKTASQGLDIFQIDLGDRAWGLNLMKVHVRNKLDQKQQLYIHIGGKRPGGGGFGMDDKYELKPHEDRWIEHWYYVPPSHVTVHVRVKFIVPVEGSKKDVSDQEPFHIETADFDYLVPNTKCNNLTMPEKLPRFQKFFPGAKHLDPFKPFLRGQMVFYCTPDTPAFKENDTIAKQRETALKKICEFAGVTPKEKIAVFFFPDQLTKKMCTMHTGDGLARGNEIYEVYNDQVKMDPYHELTHIVMKDVGAPPAMFCEGIAVYAQEGHRWNGQNVHDTARELLKTGKLVPLAELLERTEIGSREDDGDISYPESASFVGFLIENYSKEKFLQAYKKLKNGETTKNVAANISVLEEVYGQKLDQIESKWHEDLKSRP